LTERADEVFQAHSSALKGLAYRLTGSLADAEDIVQDAYLRWQRVDPSEVSNPRGYLSSTVTRLCLDSLKSARARRETYVGPWLPEPLLGDETLAADRSTELAQDVSVALMMALERLSPLERAAFILHDVFDYGYDEVAATLNRRQDACRQLASRARTHVRAARPRYQPTTDESERVVQAFVGAVTSGDLEQLRATLAEDAVLYSDGGGRVVAALRPIRSADKIIRFLDGAAKKFPFAESARLVSCLVNGSPGLVIEEAGVLVQTIAFDVRNGRIEAMFVVRNPEKLCPAVVDATND
jgi:RNA polymerase sigma-70 factor (ECF subfamily)